MVSPQLSPGDALAEQARQLAAVHAQNQALIQEAQQASELAYRSKVHAMLLCGRWSMQAHVLIRVTSVARGLLSSGSWRVTSCGSSWSTQRRTA